MLQLNNLSVGYDKKNPLIKNISYTFDKTITGILAKSGAGKTTLFKTICGIIPPLSGSFFADSEIAMMCQKNTNFNWLTCLDNVLICDRIKHKQKDKEKAKTVLAQVGLESHQNDYPSQLSGGEQQRLSLARILYLNPKILLMDEPLSALDENTRAAMQELVINQHKVSGNTILLVTHSSAEAERMCDNILHF